MVHQDIKILKDATSRPKPNVKVQFMFKNDEKVQVKVLLKQPKRTGASRNWLNIDIVGKEEPSSVNWDEVLWWRETESEQILMLSAVKENSQEVLNAKERELNSLKYNNVFNWVEAMTRQYFHGQGSILCKWVFTEKQKENGSKRLKVRLVAREFEKKSMNERTYSLTCCRKALRMVFVSASTISWELHSLDITSAFLQGNHTERDVFV